MSGIGYDPRATYFGKYKGFVRDTDDPEGRGRIRCWCPQVMGEDDDPSHWLDWAEPCFPWLGGLSALDFGVPLSKAENGGEDVPVWVEFEMGQPDFPIWVGCMTYAPRVDGVLTKMAVADSAGQIGGALIDQAASAGTGTANVDSINPPTPTVGEKEIRLMAKRGRWIRLGSAGGGQILLGPDGVHLLGVFVRHNGAMLEAGLGSIVT